MKKETYTVIIVHATSHALKAEKIIRQKNIPCKLIPVPRQLSSDCGVCVRIDSADKDLAQQALEACRIEIDGLYNF